MKHPLLARLRHAPPRRHAAFVAGLRRGAGVARVTPQARTLRRLRAWTCRVLRPVRAGPQLTLQQTVATPTVTVQSATRTLLRTHHASSVAATHHRATLLLHRAAAGLHTTAHTLVRLEKTLREARPAPPQRVAMTLARSASAAPRADAAAPRRDAEPPAVEPTRPSAPPASRPATPAFALPAQELSRVTDHVIRQLDQRVLSYRERTGRT